MTIDLILFQFIRGLAGKFKVIDWIGIFFANYLGYFLIIGAIILIFQKKNFRERFYNISFLVLSLILSRGLITEIIRFIYNRERPFVVLNFIPLADHNGGASFPSGHMAFYFALALIMTFIINFKNYGFLIAVLIMGLARIFTGVHWPSDILGGIIVGLLSVFLVKLILLRQKEGVVQEKPFLVP